MTLGSPEIMRKGQVVSQLETFGDRLKDIITRIETNDIGHQLSTQLVLQGENGSSFTEKAQKLISFFSSIKQGQSLPSMKAQIKEIKKQSEEIKKQAAQLEKSVESLKDTLNCMKALLHKTEKQ